MSAPKSDGEVRFAAGETIFSEGEPGRRMFIIEEGEVEVFRAAPSGARRLGLLGPGDFFGEMAIIDDLPRAASARAHTAVRLLALDHATFDRMLRRYPEVAIRMLRKMSARLRELEAASEAREQGTLRAVAGPPPVPSAPAAAPPPVPAAAPPAPPPVPAATAAARLELSDGTSFPLPEQGDVRVGRFDKVTGVRPEVDLTEADTGKTTSRRHAKLVREGARLLVVEEIGTANGTFVNGLRVTTGVPVEVKDGDWIQFGGVKTVLRTAG